MKIKLIMGLFLAASVFVSCDDSPAVEEVETELNDQMNQEADSLEMLNNEIDQAKEEIEASTKEVDEILNEL